MWVKNLQDLSSFYDKNSQKTKSKRKLPNPEKDIYKNLQLISYLKVKVKFFF